MTTSVPLPTLGATGFAAPAESAILAGVGTDLNAAFGGNLNLDPETPQGQWAASLTALIGAANDLFLQYVAAVDPATSSGRMQDAIGRLYFIERNPPAATTVVGNCTGASGTIIPAGALAQASDGNLYSAVNGGTIPSSGTLALTFTCTTAGAVTCPIGALNTIYSLVPGWDTISNSTAGVVGQLAESRDAFEARRTASVAVNALGIFPAIRAAVLSVSGVTDAYVTENATSSAATIGGVSIPANSLYVAVAGGTDATVAQAIWSKKNPGCAYSGNTSVVVQDTQSGYVSPYPSYTVSFTRPTALDDTIAVTIANSAAVPSDAASQIQAVVTAAYLGQDGGPPARIGATLYALRFAAPIQALGAWAQLISITVNGAADRTANINQLPTLAAVTVTLA